MMTGRIEKIGPIRSMLYVKAMAPHFVLVPTSLLPRGVGQGGKVELVIQAADAEAAEGKDNEEQGEATSSAAEFNGRPIRAGI